MALPTIVLIVVGICALAGCLTCYVVSCFMCIRERKKQKTSANKNPPQSEDPILQDDDVDNNRTAESRIEMEECDTQQKKDSLIVRFKEKKRNFGKKLSSKKPPKINEAKIEEDVEIAQIRMDELEQEPKPLLTNWPNETAFVMPPPPPPVEPAATTAGAGAASAQQEIRSESYFMAIADEKDACEFLNLPFVQSEGAIKEEQEEENDERAGDSDEAKQRGNPGDASPHTNMKIPEFVPLAKPFVASPNSEISHTASNNTSIISQTSGSKNALLMSMRTTEI